MRKAYLVLALLGCWIGTANALPVPQGIVTATGPVSLGTTPNSILNRTDVPGVSLGDKWSITEPTTEGVYDWTLVDNEIHRCVSLVTSQVPVAPMKFLTLRMGTSGGLPISTPQWVRNAVYNSTTGSFPGKKTVSDATLDSTGHVTSIGMGFRTSDYAKIMTGAMLPTTDDSYTNGTFSVSGGVTTLTSSTARFSVGDVGSTVTSTGAGLPAGTTIIFCNSITSINLSSTPTTTGSSLDFKIIARPTTVCTYTDASHVVLSRNPTSTGVNQTVSLTQRNMFWHVDHSQGGATGIHVAQPVLWDATYIAKKAAWIAATGDHFINGVGGSGVVNSTDRAAIKVVAASYANSNTEDHDMYQGTGTPDAPFPDNEINREIAMGYTTATMIEAGKTIIRATANAFPNRLVSFAIGSDGLNLNAAAANTDPFENPPYQVAPDIKFYMDRQVMNQMRTEFPGRIMIQRNNLSGNNTPPPYTRGDTFYMLWAEGAGLIAEQFLWNSWTNQGTPEGGCRNSDDETQTETFVLGGQVTAGSNVITSITDSNGLQCRFAYYDIGTPIVESGNTHIPASTTINSVPALSSTVFSGTTAVMSQSALSTGTVTFTIGAGTPALRKCDPAKVDAKAFDTALAIGSKYIETYQPDVVYGAIVPPIPTNLISLYNDRFIAAGVSPTFDPSLIRIIFVR